MRKPVPSDPEEAYRLALQKALSRLRRADAFEGELRALLARNGFAEATVERVVMFLVERRLVNDNRSIENLVASRSGKRAAGVEKIRADLLGRGAPEDKVEERLAAISPESQREAMLAVLEARCRRTDSRAKGARLLFSRGFAEDEIESTLDEFFGTEAFPE